MLNALTFCECSSIRYLILSFSYPLQLGLVTSFSPALPEYHLYAIKSRNTDNAIKEHAIDTGNLSDWEESTKLELNQSNIKKIKIIRIIKN